MRSPSVIDYSTDTTGFFGANNPQGATGAAQAKDALEAAAQFYSGVLEDTFTEIAPEKFYGSLGRRSFLVLEAALPRSGHGSQQRRGEPRD